MKMLQVNIFICTSSHGDRCSAKYSLFQRRKIQLQGPAVKMPANDHRPFLVSIHSGRKMDHVTGGMAVQPSYNCQMTLVAAIALHFLGGIRPTDDYFTIPCLCSL